MSRVAAPYPARPPLEDRSAVESRWEQCRSREPLVPLPPAAEANQRLANAFGDEPVPNWGRALGYFSFPDGGHAATVRHVETSGRLDPALKAKLAWTAARHNRAWYALDRAARRLERLGISRAAAFQMTPATPGGADREALAIALAERLTVDPNSVTDAHFVALRQSFTDPEVAEIVYVVCTENMLDRFTETLQLPLDE